MISLPVEHKQLDDFYGKLLYNLCITIYKNRISNTWMNLFSDFAHIANFVHFIYFKFMVICWQFR